jgi:hypothetical protein
MRQDDDDLENADINRALAKMRDISRKFGLDLHPNGVALAIAAAFIKSPPYIDKFLKKGEAFAAVLQKENSFKGELELVARSERQSESLFIMQVRATNRAIAIITGLWVEVADRLVHLPAIVRELQDAQQELQDAQQELLDAQQELQVAKKTYDDLTTLLLTVSNEPENEEAARLLNIALAQPLIDKLTVLAARMDAFEAAQRAAENEDDKKRTGTNNA